MTQRPPSFRPQRFGKAFTRPEASRPNAAKRGYGRKWRMIRAAFLKAHPQCACGAAATEVDHILALSKGGTNEWANLQPMCKPCHARKTVAVDGALGKKKNRWELMSVDPCPSTFHNSTEFMFGD